MDYWQLIKTNAAYRRVWLGALISLAGDWFTTIALFTQLLALTGRGEAVGLVLVARFLPHMLLGPVAGVIADRFDRKKVMILCDVARAVIVLGFLLVRETKDVPLAYALTFAQLSVSAFFEPVEQAVIGSVVSPREVVTANALHSMSWSAMLAFGAVIGGFVTSIVGRDAAFVLDAGTYVLSAIVIGGATIPKTQRKIEANHGGFKDLLEVVKMIRTNPQIRGILTAKAGWGLAGGGALVLYPVFAERELDASSAAAGLGLLYGARGVGALLGPYFARRFGGDGEAFLERAIRASFWLSLAAYFAFAFAPNVAWACLALIAAHMGASVIWTFSSALINLRVPDQIRGRIFGADNSAFTIGLTVSTLATGRALDGFGLSPRLLMIALSLTMLIPALGWSAHIAFPVRADYLLRPDRGFPKMKKVLIALVAAIAVLCIVIATRPSTFTVERSNTISARPEVVFTQVSDFHNWQAWSPWEKLDPNMKRTFEGSPAGVGAIYAWEGNKDVGKGKMTVTESKSPDKVVIKLEFIEPWPTTSETLFTIETIPEGSKLTWKMSGENNFIGKAYGLFADMDKMVGTDFEKGLAQLKSVAEAKEKELKEAEKQAAEAAAAAPPPAAPAEGAPPAAEGQPAVVK